MAEKPPVVLTIAGFDPSSGAGVTADIKTIAAHACYGVACLTALTVQSTQGVFAVESLRPELVRHTLSKLSDDLEFAAVRIGMLGSREVAEVVVDFLRSIHPPNVVLDPVLRSSSEAELIDANGVEVIRAQLLPLCAVITPNLEEAAELAQSEAIFSAESWENTLPQLRLAAAKMHIMGCRGVVITGGHLAEPNDYLSVWDSGKATEHVFAGARVDSQATHGTGCAFSTALACGLAHGQALLEAVSGAKSFVRNAMASAYPVGRGVGPMNHLFRLQERR